MKDLIDELRRPLPSRGEEAKRELKQFQTLHSSVLFDRNHPLHGQAAERSRALSSLLPDSPDVLGHFRPTHDGEGTLVK